MCTGQGVHKKFYLIVVDMQKSLRTTAPDVRVAVFGGGGGAIFHHARKLFQNHHSLKLGMQGRLCQFHGGGGGFTRPIPGDGGADQFR